MPGRELGRQHFGPRRPHSAVKKTVSSPRAAEQTPDKKKQSRFAALVGSLGFGNTPTTEKRYRRHLLQVGETDERRTSRAAHRFWQDACRRFIGEVYLPHQRRHASTSRSAASTCVLPVLEVVL